MAEDLEDDLDLNALSTEDLIDQMHDDLYNGMKAEIEEEAVRLVKEKAIPEWDALVIAGDTVRERRNARSTPVEH